MFTFQTQYIICTGDSYVLLLCVIVMCYCYVLLLCVIVMCYCYVLL